MKNVDSNKQKLTFLTDFVGVLEWWKHAKNVGESAIIEKWLKMDMRT